MTKVNFNAAIDEIYVAVMKRYPLARFYEAQGYLTEDVNGDVKPDSVKLAFAIPDKDSVATIIGTLDEEGKPKIKKVADVWCEDFVTTPYVPLTADQAINILKEKFGGFKKVKAGPITLRHMLYPGEIEPKYFIGTFMDCHSVGVYSAQVDTTFVTEHSNYMVMQRY
jgi:hypothetical protein